MKRFEKRQYNDKKQGYYYYDNKQHDFATLEDYEKQTQSNFIRFCMFSSFVIAVLLFIYFIIK